MKLNSNQILDLSAIENRFDLRDRGDTLFTDPDFLEDLKIEHAKP
jgi:hypothetical protein